MMIDVGGIAPDIRFETADGGEARLSDYRGRPLVLYFYPKDDTAGCTREAQDFTALADEFAKAGTAVIGISKDPPKKHRAFSAKYDLTVDLVTDADGSACEAFGVWGERTLYGRKYMGIERATFLIDAGGRIVRSWRQVKVPGHAEEVLAAARSLA